MVSLKSLVSGILILRFLSSLIVGPYVLGPPNVFLLSFFCPAPEQSHKPLTIPAEVNSITGPEIDRALVQAGADAFRIGEISLAHSRYGYCHLGSRVSVQAVKPFSVRVAAVNRKIFANVDHNI